MLRHRLAIFVTFLGAELAAACGGGSGGGADAGPVVDADPNRPDGPPTPDANAACNPVSGTPAMDKQMVASGFTLPVAVAAAPGDARLFVAEKTGTIQAVSGSQKSTWLNVSNLVGGDGSFDGEQGLLGLAFHPGFATNGRFFINYTKTNDDSTVVEYHATPGGATADSTPVKTILTVTQPYSNHNGGHLAFGPDGYLYIGFGDGGAGDDPDDNGQDLQTLLGKMLRIDVDGGDPYGIPAGNLGGGARPEIWSYGLRNPWRYAFDRATGDLYIGDVGQGMWEEIDVQPAGQGGQNWGWDCREGTHNHSTSASCAGPFVAPVFEYSHADSAPEGGQSVTGGVVYRGCKMPDLGGTYFFADFAYGWVRSFRWTGGAVPASAVEHHGNLDVANVSAFGEDGDGEVYYLEYHGSNGKLFKIVPM